MEYNFAFHNSHISQYRAPFGAVAVGTKVTLKILVDRGVETFLYIKNYRGNEQVLKMNWEGDSGNRSLFSTKIDTSNFLGLNQYYFKLRKDDKYFYYGNNTESLGGEGKVYYNAPVPYQITVYRESYTPEWFKNGIMYQIFPDRFCNGNENGVVNYGKMNSFIYSNWDDEPMYIKDYRGKIIRWDFYGGNLKGIIKNIPYLKELGVSIIYMNPIFEAESCHRYDAGDYEKIDCLLGTEEDFKELCEKAHEANMKIILDGVFSHTGSNSKYFNKLGNYDNVGAYQSKDSPYYSWYSFKNYPDEYDCWWGFENQPNVDELNPKYLDYIVTGKQSIIYKWLNLGANGWRLDVADELPDEFIQLIKKRMRETDSESVLIGEVWEDASNKVSYSRQREYFYGSELDSVTNYPLREIIINYVKCNIDAEYFSKRLNSMYENYPRNNFFSLMNMLGSHDTERILSVLNEDLTSLKLALLVQMSLPGVPVIYYGDEAGLLGGKDPENRRPYPWGRENIKVYEMFKKMIEFRNKNSILSQGDFSIEFQNKNVAIIDRWHKDHHMIIAINNSDSDKKVILKKNSRYSLKNYMTNNKLQSDDDKYSVVIERRGYSILESI